MPLPNYGSPKRQIPVLDHRAAASGWSPPRSEPVEEVAATHEMSGGERARTIIGNNRLGVLSVTVAGSGAPLGFAVPYAVREDGRPLMGIRPGIEHAAHLATGMAASLAVAETPLSATTAGTIGGVTLTGPLRSIVDGDEFDAAVSEYGRTQPADANAMKRGEGHLYLLAPESILVFTGQGEVTDLELGEYSSASSDPLAAVAPGLVTHLSNDQGGSLVLLCRAFGGQPGASSASLAGIDQYGMDLLVTTPHGRESVRLNFGHPVATPEEVRRELTVMARGARFKLGVG